MRVRGRNHGARCGSRVGSVNRVGVVGAVGAVGAVGILVLAAGLVAGCAAIPESTPVVVVDEHLGGPQAPTVPAPVPGLNPLSVVRQFVEAGVSHADEHEAARSYLTADAARKWDDAAPIMLLEDDFGTAPFDPAAPDADRRRVVMLRATQIGLLDASGVFRLRREDVVLRLTVLIDNGEWRIDDPPRGLLMRIRDFRATFRVVDLSFVDPDSNMLITDRRWVLNWPPSAVPRRVVGLLLGDPSLDLRGSVINELSGARLTSNVAPAPDGVLTVELTGLGHLNRTQRKLAAAQIARTIGEVVDQPVEILHDGQPLLPDREQWRLEDTRDFVPSMELAPGLPGFVVSNGRIRPIGSNPQGAQVEIANAVSAAQSADGRNFAVVAIEPTGVPRLWVGPPGGLKPVELPATKLSKPNWRRGRNQVWIVADGHRLVSVEIVDGQPRVQPVDATELARYGVVSQLRLSRDGVRIAAIVNNALVVGSVVGTGTQMSIRNTRVLPPPNPTQLVDVDFLGTDHVVVATASLDQPVYESSLDGLTTLSFNPSKLAPPISSIAAVSGRPLLVADRFGVWSSRTASSLWQKVPDFGPNSVPVYPG